MPLPFATAGWLAAACAIVAVAGARPEGTRAAIAPTAALGPEVVEWIAAHRAACTFPVPHRAQAPAAGPTGAALRTLDGLDAAQPKARREAVLRLARVDLAALPAAFAFAALCDVDASVREEALLSLVEIDDPWLAGKILEQGLRDPATRVRLAAIETVVDLGGADAAWTLAIALRDDDPRVREDAVYALDEIGGAIAEVLLRQALADPHESVRASAAEVLEEGTDEKP